MDMDEIRRAANDACYSDEEEFPHLLRLPFYCDERESTLEIACNLAQFVDPSLIYLLHDSIPCVRSPESHLGPFCRAIDFILPYDTMVLAASPGVIVDVKDDSDRYGPTEDFANDLNYVTIQCPDAGENRFSCFTQYCHLKQGSAKEFGIRKGDEVREGLPIGLTGKNGWMSGNPPMPHLHFLCFRGPKQGERLKFGFMSMRLRFDPRLISWIELNFARTGLPWHC